MRRYRNISCLLILPELNLSQDIFSPDSVAWPSPPPCLSPSSGSSHFSFMILISFTILWHSVRSSRAVSTYLPTCSHVRGYLFHIAAVLLQTPLAERDRIVELPRQLLQRATRRDMLPLLLLAPDTMALGASTDSADSARLARGAGSTPARRLGSHSSHGT